MSTTDVRVEHVTKRYDAAVAVDDMLLDINHGEFFSVLGPSGCGKTTTLRMIAGFDAPSSGTIYLGGHDVTRLPAHKRDVNTVFQSYALFPHLNVHDNVAFGPRQRGASAAEVATRVAETLELVQLQGYGARRPSQLSGGQQQRVALARALINRPRVLLLDEPLGALDLKLRKQMQIELKRIQTEVGITFLYVTHDQDEAMTMSDRIAVMRAGRIEQLGTPAELYERPATEFVAGFLGASNLLAGKLVRGANGLSEVDLSVGRRILAAAPELPGGAEVRVGIRPEKLRISSSADSAERQSAGLNVLEGRVVDASYVGVSTQYLVATDDGTRLLVYAQNVDTVGTADQFRLGEPVVLTWQPEHTFVIADNAGSAKGPPGQVAA